jgi:hypothetical protein
MCRFTRGGREYVYGIGILVLDCIDGRSLWLGENLEAMFVCHPRMNGRFSSACPTSHPSHSSALENLVQVGEQ